MSISLGVRYTSIIFIDLSCFRTFPSLFLPSQNTGVAGPHDQLASLCYYIIKIPAGRNSLTARYFGKNILDIVYTSTDYFLKWLNYILLLARAGTASPNLTSTLKKKSEVSLSRSVLTRWFETHVGESKPLKIEQQKL